MEANILLGFIGMFLAGGILVALSRFSHQARQDRRDAERWRRLTRYRDELRNMDLEDAACRAKFDEECG